MAINVSNIVTALQAKQNLVTNDTDILEISKLLKAIINSNEELVSIVNISYVDGLGDALALKANLTSPSFTGTPLSTTPINGDNSTKIATTEFVMQNGVPSGSILLWSGSVASIPVGWYLCDGTNDTPNLPQYYSLSYIMKS